MSYGGANNFYLYINLTGGKSIEDALLEMQENTHNSMVKEMVDTWYEENMDEFTNEIEDTSYCNDRSVFLPGGFNPNGGGIDASLYLVGTIYYRKADVLYAANYRLSEGKPNLGCKRKNDSFMMSSERGNGKLDYPVGLITADEAMLAGLRTNVQNLSNSYLGYHSNWTISPHYFLYLGYSTEYIVTGDSILMSSDTGSGGSGLRPIVSLKPGTHVISGNGTGASPYIVK